MSPLLPLLLLLAGAPGPAGPADPLDALRRVELEAERALQDGERRIAESRLRSALLEGYLALGFVEEAEDRLPEARQAFERALDAVVDAPHAQRALAVVQIRMGDAAQAASGLTRLVTRHPKDIATRSLLARALFAAGQPQQGIQELVEAAALAPDDLELVYALGSGYLSLKKPAEAERAFARLIEARPIPETLVLVGRTYRDYGESARARAALERALRQSPRVPRAHYHLGLLALATEGLSSLDTAIAEFRAELALRPDDPFANLRLGMALTIEQKAGEAAPHLEKAARHEAAAGLALQYLGRCQLQLGEARAAAASLERALERLAGPGADPNQLGQVHYQLGTALRRLGEESDAVRHFAEAERLAVDRVGSDRERLARYLADLPDEADARQQALVPPAASPLAALAPPLRAELRRRCAAAVARALFNLGVMKAQDRQFARAAEFLESAAAVDPAFPRVQYTLGVAYFNAGRFEKAAAPLEAARAESPGDAELVRMLALAWLNTGAFDSAAELLRADSSLRADASLQYAYGVALTRAGRAADAEAVFARLLARHGGDPEVMVLLGQAQAQQGDFDGALQTFGRAIEARPDVAQAHSGQGMILLKQGRLDEAEAALRAELGIRPDDVPTQHTLAAVLDLLGRGEEALPLLRAALKSRPDYVDSRYLLGKILLGRGAPQDAAEQLEAAARLAPEDANVRYQLAQAYQKLGDRAAAEREFEAFRLIKDRRREDEP